MSGGLPQAAASTSAASWFATPGPFTGLGAHELDLALDGAGRPSISDVVRTVQGLLIYDLVAAPFYGVDLTPTRADDVNIRPVAELLDRARTLDLRPLTEPRSPANRVAARCRTYATLTVAILRAHGMPARARCGFGGYFRRGWYEDHWIAEYHHPQDHRWVMVDAQLDDAWTSAIGFAGDPLDVTPEEFVTAERAWTGWRTGTGTVDAGRYGLSSIDEHGAHWISGNLRLDVTALAKLEMQPWDVWGDVWKPDEPVPDDLTLFDRMAELTADPDAHVDAIRALCRDDPRVHMPGTVFNVLRHTTEAVPT